MHLTWVFNKKYKTVCLYFNMLYSLILEIDIVYNQHHK